MSTTDLKTLTALISRAEAIESRVETLKSELATIKTKKEELLADGSASDQKLMVRAGELGGQESLLNIQLGKVLRERDGMAAALLNEADATQKKVISAVVERRDKWVSDYAKAITPFFPELSEKQVAQRADSDCAEAAWFNEMSRHTHKAQFYTKHQTELAFARSVLGSMQRAIDASLL